MKIIKTNRTNQFYIIREFDKNDRDFIYDIRKLTLFPFIKELWGFDEHEFDYSFKNQPIDTDKIFIIEVENKKSGYFLIKLQVHLFILMTWKFCQIIKKWV